MTMKNVGAPEPPPQQTKGKGEDLKIDDTESIASTYQMVSDIFNFNELRDLDNFYIKRYRKNNATYKG